MERWRKDGGRSERGEGLVNGEIREKIRKKCRKVERKIWLTHFTPPHRPDGRPFLS